VRVGVSGRGKPAARVVVGVPAVFVGWGCSAGELARVLVALAAGVASGVVLSRVMGVKLVGGGGTWIGGGGGSRRGVDAGIGVGAGAAAGLSIEAGAGPGATAGTVAATDG
jgi:hypothetical protein